MNNTTYGAYGLETTQETKERCVGREVEILERVAGLDPFVLDGKNHPCPLCGGKDRFRLFNVRDGLVMCNRCFHPGQDFIAAVMHFRGWSFPKAMEEIREYLSPGSSTPAPASRPSSPPAQEKAPEKKTRWCPIDLLDEKDPQAAILMEIWCKNYGGVSMDSIRMFDGWAAKRYGTNIVTFPVWQFEDGVRMQSAWYSRRVDCKPFEVNGKQAGKSRIDAVEGWKGESITGIAGSFYPLAHSYPVEEITFHESLTDALAADTLVHSDSHIAHFSVNGRAALPNAQTPFFIKGLQKYGIHRVTICVQRDGDSQNVTNYWASQWKNTFKKYQFNVQFVTSYNGKSDLRDWVKEVR